MKVTHKAGIAIVLLLGGTAAVWAQVKTEDAGGSLAALTAEVHQLRLAVEESTRSQTQTQGLAVYLAAQQSRMVQLSSRLDAVRGEITGASARAQQSADLLAQAQKASTQSTDQEQRQAAADMIPMFKQQADQSAAALQDLRKRESELVLALQSEEQRWTDLIAQLQQAIKR